MLWRCISFIYWFSAVCLIWFRSLNGSWKVCVKLIEHFRKRAWWWQRSGLGLLDNLLWLMELILGLKIELKHLRCCGRTLHWVFMLGNPSVWLKTILQITVGQNVSTVMWKTHCQLSQTPDCKCCCQERHNQLLGLGGNYVFTKAGLGSFK